MILVVAEQRGGKLNRATWEAIAAAQQLGEPLTVAVIGSGISAIASEVAAADVQEVVTIDAAALEPYTPDGFTGALAQAIEQLKPTVVFLPHTYQTRDFAPKLAARLDRALVTDVTAIKPGPAICPPDVSRQADRRRRAAGPRAAFRHDSDRFLPRRQRAQGLVARGGPFADGERRRRVDSAEARGAVPGSATGRRFIPGGADRLCRTGNQRAGQASHRAAARRCAPRRARGLASDLRRGMAADGAAGRKLRADRRAEALSRARHFRRHPASRRHEGYPDDRRHQQGSRRADLRDRRLRHRRRSVRDRPSDDRGLEVKADHGPTCRSGLCIFWVLFVAVRRRLRGAGRDARPAHRRRPRTVRPRRSRRPRASIHRRRAASGAHHSRAADRRLRARVRVLGLRRLRAATPASSSCAASALST